MNNETEITEKRFVEGSWKEKTGMGRAAAVIPAVGCFAFIRTDMGYRLVKPIYFYCLAALLCVMAAVGHRLAEPFPCVLVIFAVIMVGLGLRQRIQRWNQLSSGRKQHTFCPGESVLEHLHLPLPAFLKKNRRLY